MAMRIKFGADDGAWADQRAHARDDIAFDVVVTVRDHGAVQAEEHAVDGQRVLELPEDLVAHRLVVLAVGRARRTCREAAPLDEGKALFDSASPRDPELRSAKERRLVRMFAGPQEHTLLVGVEARRQWRECIRLGRYRGRKQAHTSSSLG